MSAEDNDGFALPDEATLAPVLHSFPARERQIRWLATLVYPQAAPVANLVLYGTEATAKSAVTEQLLPCLAASSSTGFGHAIINAAQCISARQLFERIVAAVARALHRAEGAAQGEPATELPRRLARCETLAQLAVALETLLVPRGAPKASRWRFVLVLDGIDRQRDASPALVPGLARLSETIDCLGCIFIVTVPWAGLLRLPAAKYLHFPPYSKADYMRIMALTPPPQLAQTTLAETNHLWTRFCATVHDALVRPASRTLPALRHACRVLWPRFTAPVAQGSLGPNDFSRLLVAARPLLQDETLLCPSIISHGPLAQEAASTTDPVAATTAIAAPARDGPLRLLPMAARLLLLSAYLASHNAVRHDLVVFSTQHHGRRRRRGARGPVAASSRPGTNKHRRIARKLLGAHAFVLERMLAIFEAVRLEWTPDGCSLGAAGLDADVAAAVATLASLRLLVRVGAGDVMDRAGKWRINAGWETVRGIGRSIGVEVDEWLIES
ncbi:hypothetical protein CDD82_2444 [Ophiocordyceps australis]|uniref:Uncharacterized protein n=1 Tax=Ophiocordyceps australis TaxID=1399860 RepID=A0A2C5ZHY5_9HYPO|nr:hypothetical protein CDD82_2444 [Ophiocordyceps australis]